jgi:hypothetical protein
MSVASLTRTSFAELAGVSKPAITKAVAAGHILIGLDGRVDPDNPLNAAYLARHLEGKAPKPEPEPKAARVRKAAKKIIELTGQNPEDANDLVTGALEAVNLDKEKKRADIFLKRAQTRRHELAEAEQKGRLVPHEIIKRKFSAFDAALKSHMRDMPRRTAARLHAIAIAQGPQALEAELETEISEALRRVVDAAKEQGLGE